MKGAIMVFSRDKLTCPVNCLKMYIDKRAQSISHLSSQNFKRCKAVPRIHGPESETDRYYKIISVRLFFDRHLQNNWPQTNEKDICRMEADEWEMRRT